MRKLGFLFLFFFCLSANGFGQTNPTISITAPQTTVGAVLSEITRQTQLEFSFNSKKIDTEERLSFVVESLPLEETLSIFCQKIEATYELVEGQIILFARKRHTISGFITDQKTGETLIGATVAIMGTSKGVFTNEFGYYSLLLPSGKHQIHYAHVGFSSLTKTVELEKNEQTTTALQPISLDLPQIEVSLPLQNLLDKKNLGQPEFAPHALSSMPEFLGESGLIKGLQSFPGIKTHGDGSAFFFTRGGARDQNLVIIDDAPIFNPSHMFGFYSLVIPDLAKSIKVYKSDIPATLGDRLSSVIDIRTKDGNQKKFQLSGAINPLVNRFSFETPLFWKKGAFLASYRKSNFEPFFKNREPNANLSFGDLILKLNTKIGKKDRVFLTGIWSGDNLTNNNEGLVWGNVAGTFRWNHIFNSKLFSNTTFNTGTYYYRLKVGNNRWQSTLGSASVKTEFTHFASPEFNSRFGFEVQGFFTEPGRLTNDSTRILIPEIKTNNSQKNVLFYQSEWDFSERIKIKVGLRFLNWVNRGPTTYYTFDDQFEVTDTVEVDVRRDYQNFIRLDPRFSVQYRLDKTTRLSAGFGRYHQFLQMVSNSDSPFSAFEVWLPPSVNIRPQRAYQYDINYLKYFQKSNLEFSAAAYLKKLNNQIEYENHSKILINPLVEGELRFGESTAYGLEFFLKKETGRLAGRLGYDFSKTLQQFPDLNNGNRFNALQDRPHEISLLLNYPLKRRILLSTYWTYASGFTFTSPTAFYDFNGQTIPVYNEVNNDRLPAYHRMDMAIKFIFNKSEASRFHHSLSFSIYNIYAHKNTYTVKFNKLDGGNRFLSDRLPGNLLSETPLTASQIDLFRFMPSLTYKFKI